MSDTIIPFFKDCAFNPQATQVMGAAYEKACEALHDIGQPDIVKEIIARRIIEVAQTGERDIDRLSSGPYSRWAFASGRSPIARAT